MKRLWIASYGLEFYQFRLGYLESPSVRIADDVEEIRRVDGRVVHFFKDMEVATPVENGPRQA